MLRLGYGESVELITKSICEERKEKWLQRINKMDKWYKELTGKDLDIDKLESLCEDKYNTCLKNIGKPVKRR